MEGLLVLEAKLLDFFSSSSVEGGVVGVTERSGVGTSLLRMSPAGLGVDKAFNFLALVLCL